MVAGGARLIAVTWRSTPLMTMSKPPLTIAS